MIISQTWTFPFNPFVVTNNHDALIWGQWESDNLCDAFQAVTYTLIHLGPRHFSQLGHVTFLEQIGMLISFLVNYGHSIFKVL